MQILGINNYYQPKYLNVQKQRKTNNIQQLQSYPDSFESKLAFKSGYMIKVNGFNNLRNFQNLKHPDNKAFYEQLKKKLNEVPYYEHSEMDREHCYGDLGEHIIEGVWNACLDANKVVNKYAAQVLFNMCRLSDKPCKELDIPEWKIKDDKSEIFDKWGIQGVKTLIKSAKDENGNHHLENLKFMLYLYKTYKYASADWSLADVFQRCTNEKGIITPKAAERAKSIFDKPDGWKLNRFMKQITKLDDKGIEFLNNVFDRLTKNKRKGKSFDIDEKYELLLRDVLSDNKSKDADKIYDILNKNLDLIDKNSTKALTCWEMDATPIVENSYNSNEEISLKNLEKLLKFLKNEEYDLFDNADLFKDKRGIIRDENIEAYKKLNLYVQNRKEQGYYDEEEQLWNVLNDDIKGYKNKNGVVNLEFANRIANLCEKYEFDSINGYVRNLFNIIRDFQNNKKPINWDIVEMLCKYTKKAINADYTLDRHTLANLNNDVLSFIKDENTSEILPEKYEIFNKYAEIDNPDSFKSMHQIRLQLETENTLKNYFKNNSEYGNLYTADDMLELLRDMSEEGILNTGNILTTPIKEYDSPILMYIADIFPTEENAKKYDKILKILSYVKNVDYNYRDSFGVSFLEKVMMSENSKLLELMKDEPLEYYPELEYAYQNIQNPEFKAEVSRLNFALTDDNKLVGTSKKIEEKAKSIENEKPLLAAILRSQQ